jgi:hypothetical protein
MKNRESRHPGRVKLIPVDVANGIYDMERADDPIDPGTPLNKKLLDFAVAACGATAGTASAYTLDDEFGGFTLTDGARVNFRLHVASRANPTLDVNGTGAKPITNETGTPLETSMPAGTWLSGTYSSAFDSFVVSVSGASYSASLSAYTWAQIAEISASGQAKNTFYVGDEINVSVGNEIVTFVIVGFDHDTTAGGTKAGITFGMKNLMANTRIMDTDASSLYVYYDQTDLYDWLVGTVYESLPADLKGVIKTVNKKILSDPVGGSKDVATKLFLFSENEVGAQKYGFIAEGERYSYFATNASRTKRLSNGSGGAAKWWTRTVSGSGSTVRYCIIDTGGASDYEAPNNSFGVCFGFCV